MTANPRGTAPDTGRAVPTAPRRRSRAALALGAVASLVLVAACGAGADEPGASNVIESGKAPSYYPAAYKDVIAASKKEGGALTIYSNTDQENWAPIFRDFQKKYPWVKKISANNLDSDEVFQRVLSEQASNGSPADVLVSNASQAWADFAERSGTLLPYKSPELAKLPANATLLPNVSAMSMDPLSIIYNSSLVSGKPTGLRSLADIVAKDPGKYKGKITTRDVTGAFGFSVSHAFTEGRPEAWSTLEKLLPLGKAESSSGTQLEKVLSGEYLAGFFVSAAPAYPKVEESGGLLALTFLDDGTVVMPRGIGIAAKAPHTATAKLFTDFVLSAEGQRAVAEGGLTSYREGIEATDGRHTYQELVKAVGRKNVIDVKYTKVPDAQVKAFTTRWDGLLGR
ncbi:ABC transporter substrate-binding protein [Streptomyces coeruleorubidus]|uniref:ABC transporter substrate-binding protein n=1 Tax=Streptomyces coeruleorubidus TaxID=116188 RepID=UPI0033B33981